MDVFLYQNSSDPSVVNKSITQVAQVTDVRFKEPDSLDVRKPSLLLNIANDASDLATFNYCRIPKLSRYYYVTDIAAEGDLVRIDCLSDPLMSFKSDILGSTQYISRQQYKKNKYMVDNMLPIHSDHSYKIKTFGSQVEDPHCLHVILETIGKGGAIDG